MTRAMLPTGEATLAAIPELETARLRLRAPRMADFEAYAAFCNSERSRSVGGPYSRGPAFHRFSALLGHWALRGYGRWLVADRSTDEALGVVGPMYPVEWPEPEIAWTVFGAAEGRGIALEAALASRRYAYEVLGWHTAVSLVAPGNTRSQALALRMGATREESFEHPDFGELLVWRHPSPKALSGAQA